MERILVFSDSHGEIRKTIQIIKNMQGVTAVLHLGDLNRDIQALEDEFPDIPVYGVQGNNDFTGAYPNEKTITIRDKKIFITHGHYYLVNGDPSKLKTIPATESADIILYGHTHIAYTEKFDNKILANPGSITKPLQGEPSYGVIEIENGKLSYCTIPVHTLF